VHKRLRTGLVALLIVAAYALTGCSPEPSTHFVHSAEELHSEDATVQARLALEQFFNAMTSSDCDAPSAFVDQSQMPDSGWHLKRVIVETITAEPSASPEAAPGSAREQRTFYAPIRMWPSDGSFEAGELMGWSWMMQRGRDGRWRLVSWGWG